MTVKHLSAAAEQTQGRSAALWLLTVWALSPTWGVRQEHVLQVSCESTDLCCLSNGAECLFLVEWINVAQVDGGDEFQVGVEKAWPPF